MLRTLTISAGLVLILALPAAAADTVDNPRPGTVHHALVEGLILVRDQKFQPFLDKYCHPDDLCFNANSRKSLLKYNLPALSRIGGKCLKGEGRTLKVTRTDGDPAKDDQIKLFVVCDPRGMPRPFTLKKKGSAWMWKKI
ncbi:MAG: hypothetical protein ACI9WU_002289 [Myxococcota bacterium]|jgi:hypothetical protein